jgi:putative peptidoglycan lipid II flippase
LLAAALATLGVGLLPYGAFLLLARAYYALGDSRTPGIVSLIVALAGVSVMVVGALTTHGAARIAVLGAGHTSAYLLGALVLMRGVARRTGGSVWPAGLARMAGLAAVAGVATWAAGRALLEPASGRTHEAVIVVVLVALGGLALLAGHRLLGLSAALTRREEVPPLDGSAATPVGAEVPEEVV